MGRGGIIVVLLSTGLRQAQAERTAGSGSWAKYADCGTLGGALESDRATTRAAGQWRRPGTGGFETRPYG